jgi:cytochrome c peroxidase
MTQTRLFALSAACSVIVAAMFITTDRVRGEREDEDASPGRVYNPYPPGILPSDLDPEIERVRRELRVLEQRAFARWRALPLPTLAGNPPTLQNSGTELLETLGELMNYDQNMSPNRNLACSFCHMPYAGFSGPIPSVNLTMVAYPGTAHFRAGKRTAQRYTYAPFFPVLQYNEVQGLFFGGNFWDSRATGFLQRNPDAEQAQHPPVDTQEMGFPDTACIAFRLSHANYKSLFEEVWGKGSLDIDFPADTEQICHTPAGAAVFNGSATPIPLSAEDRTRANEVFNHWGQSIDAYEQSRSSQRVLFEIRCVPEKLVHAHPRRDGRI